LEAWNRRDNKQITEKEALDGIDHPLKNQPDDYYPRSEDYKDKRREVMEMIENDPEESVDENGLNILRVMLLVVGITYDAIMLYVNGISNYYYFNLGKNIFGLPMKLFLLFDYVLATNVVVPTDPWVSYRYKREEKYDICPVCPTTITKNVEYTDGTSNVGDDRVRFNQFYHINKDISCE
tara:strand:- start:190 stop:729 length:540 start_codon:yes stop_codon:yes gene_type:complete